VYVLGVSALILHRGGIFRFRRFEAQRSPDQREEGSNTTTAPGFPQALHGCGIYFAFLIYRLQEKLKLMTGCGSNGRNPRL
jgi:hypothetical protein